MTDLLEGQPQAPSTEEAKAMEESREHWTRDLALALYLHGKVIHDEGLIGERAGEEALRTIRRRIGRRMLKGITKGLLFGRVLHESHTVVKVKEQDGTEVERVIPATYRRPEGHEKPWQKRRRRRKAARL